MTVLIAVSTAYPVNEGELSKERLSKAASFRNADDRVRSLRAGWALDAALRTVGLRERDVTVVYDDHGKPVLQDHPHLHFSLSHSGEWAVCALSDVPVGVDVELIRPIDAARLVNRWLPAEQAAEWETDPSIERFFKLWTRRESLLKAQGVGLSGVGTASEDGFYFREYALDGYALTLCTKGEFPEMLTIIQ